MQENTKSVAVKMTARRCFRTEPIWQYDVGHELVFEGFNLPTAFEVHFSRSSIGKAITQIGTNDVCTVPDMFAQNAGVVYAWMYIAEEDTGLTKFSIEMPVQPKAKPTDQQPEPVEQSAIDQAISALNAGVEAAEDAQEAAEAAQASAESYAESAGQSAITATNAASSAASAKTAAETAARNAATSATDAHTSREAADQSATNAGVSERAAASSASAAAGSATSAAASAGQASASATAASGSASTASTKASEAAQSATAAAGSAASASEDAGTASTAATAAEASATAAAGSATAAAGSATSAGQSAAAAAGSAQTAQDVLDSIPADYSELSDDVNSLKSALNDSTGNREIQFSDYTLRQCIDTSGSVIPWDSQTDKPITSTVASNAKWAIVHCNPGDTFTISGRGSNADRFWAFADKNKNILDPRGVPSDRATELLIVAPENARYLIINNREDTKSYYGELVKQDVSAIKNANKNVVGYERPYFNRKTFANWVSSSEMWGYGTYANNAATPAGILYPLKTGDTIELTDYSGVVFAVFTSNGHGYKRYINLSNKFTATEDCNVAITIQYAPGVALDDSNYSSLVNRVYIVHNVGMYADINSKIDTEISKTKGLTIDTNFKSIAHRGYSYGYPENTEISFIKAVQEGFKIVETDIRLTSDGIPVLLHDDTINRTGRNVDGTQISQTISIADITYQQALQYDFGIYAGAQFAGQKILSFDKFMGLCRNLGLKTLLEIKLTEIVAACQPIIDRYAMNDNVTYLGLISYIDYVYNQNPNAKYAMLVNTITDAIIAEIKERRNLGKNVIMDANYENITQELLEAVKSEDIPLIVFTINNDDTILNLDPYISGVTSDYKNAGAIIYNHYMSLLP